MTVVARALLIALVLWIPVAQGQETNFATDQVTVDVAKCQTVQPSQRQFACHRLEPGEGFVVGERRYWPPKKTDDDAFEKLTVYFASRPKVGYAVDLPSDEVAVSFSSGPSSFPGKHGCYGMAKAGRVEVTGISEFEVTIKVDVSIDLKSPLGWQGECKEARLTKAVAAHIVGFDRLDAWHGLVKQSDALWKESHP